jgi:hypothetical protein
MCKRLETRIELTSYVDTGREDEKVAGYVLLGTWFAMDIRWRLLRCRGGKKPTRGVLWTMSLTSLNQVVL